VKLQLAFRSLNRVAEGETRCEPELNPKESALYSLLYTGEGKTTVELAEAMSVDTTEVYFLIRSLQDKKLAKAISRNPIKFVAIKRGVSFE